VPKTSRDTEKDCGKPGCPNDRHSQVLARDDDVSEKVRLPLMTRCGPRQSASARRSAAAVAFGIRQDAKNSMLRDIQRSVRQIAHRREIIADLFWCDLDHLYSDHLLRRINPELRPPNSTPAKTAG